MGGFWDNYTPKSTLPPFVSSEEKQLLAELETPILIKRVSLRTGGQFGDQFNVDVVVEGQEETKTISFQKGGTMVNRDDTLEEMQDFLQGGGDPIRAKLTFWGRGIGIEPITVQLENESQPAEETPLEAEGDA